jgi:flagellar motor switch protein FliM
MTIKKKTSAKRPPPPSPQACFTGVIRNITSRIDEVGDKVAKMTIEFYATNGNLEAVQALQQPETMVNVSMEMSDNG